MRAKPWLLLEAWASLEPVGRGTPPWCVLQGVAVAVVGPESGRAVRVP